MEAPLEQDTGTQPGPATVRALATRRFLVADDDRDMCAFIAHILRNDGADVVETDRGLDLLELSTIAAGGPKRDAFDAIFADIQMPDYGALDVLRKLPNIGHKSPVIVVTAFGDPKTRQQGYELGAALVLNKPIDPVELRALVRAVIRQSAIS